MSKKWTKVDSFRYEPFQAFWDFEFNHSEKNKKLACEQSFKTAWNYEPPRLKKAQEIIKQKDAVIEKLEKGLESIVHD